MRSHQTTPAYAGNNGHKTLLLLLLVVVVVVVVVYTYHLTYRSFCQIAQKIKFAILVHRFSCNFVSL